MSTQVIDDIKRVFISRLDALEHILTLGKQHLPDIDAAMIDARLAPDMLPLGTQVAFACNQPRGFSQWCAGQPIQNLDRNVTSLEQAFAHVRDTRAMVEAIRADDARLDDNKRTGLGPGMYFESPARVYVSDYLLPNLYFHITTTYAILRGLGVPLGKADFMYFLRPLVQQEAAKR